MKHKFFISLLYSFLSIAIPVLTFWVCISLYFNKDSLFYRNEILILWVLFSFLIGYYLVYLGVRTALKIETDNRISKFIKWLVIIFPPLVGLLTPFALFIMVAIAIIEFDERRHFSNPSELSGDNW